MKVKVDFVEVAMRRIFENGGEPLIYDDPANGERLPIEAGAAAAADGLLPAILLAGEAVWRNLTRKGFELDLARDPSALLGYRVRSIGGPTFSIVMLASLEALDQVRTREGIIVNGFNAIWATPARAAPPNQAQSQSQSVRA